MITLFILAISTQAFSREFPDKEIIRRCDLRKVQSCIEENRNSLNFVSAEQANVSERLILAKQELNENQNTIAPIDDEISALNLSLAVIDNFFREKNVENQENLPIFLLGPTLPMTKVGQFMQPPIDSPDQNSLNTLLQKDKIDLEIIRTSLGSEQLLLSNRINELQAQIAIQTQQISEFDVQKRQHGRMCEFGCKEKFCPEN